MAPYEVGKPIMGGVLAQVVESGNERLQKGAVVVGNLPLQQYAVYSGKGLNEVHPDVVPLRFHLGILDVPALTA